MVLSLSKGSQKRGCRDIFGRNITLEVSTPSLGEVERRHFILKIQMTFWLLINLAMMLVQIFNSDVFVLAVSERVVEAELQGLGRGYEDYPS